MTDIILMIVAAIIGGVVWAVGEHQQEGRVSLAGIFMAAIVSAGLIYIFLGWFDSY